MGRLPDLPINKTTAELIGELRKPEVGTDTAWYKTGPSEPHGINYQDDWTTVAGASSPDAGWYLSKDGEVRMRGRVTGGEDGSTILTLPSDVRPEFTQTFIIGSDTEDEFNLDLIRFRASFTATNFEEVGP